MIARRTVPTRRALARTALVRAALVTAALVAAGAAGCRRRHHAPAGDDAGGADPDVVAAWRADLAYLAAELPRHHVDLFATWPEADFRAAVADLGRRLPELDAAERFVGVARIVARVGDSHTGVEPSRGLARVAVPLGLAVLIDGVVIVDAVEPYRDLIGARVDAIGGVPAGQALDRVAELFAHDSPSTVALLAPTYLRMVPVMQALGLAGAEPSLALAVTTAAGQHRDVVVPVGVPRRNVPPAPPPDPGPLPLYRQHGDLAYWSTYVPERRLVYVGYHQCVERADLPWSRFAADTLALIDDHPVDRVVIDLRDNAGGNSTLIAPLLVGVRERPAVRGRLFAIIGRRTFSSGLMNAIELDQAGAVLVGEPTAGKPDHFGEVGWLTLPRSRLRVSYSQKRFAYPGYPGPALAPEVPAAVTWADHVAGRDPVLDAAVAQPVPATAVP